MKLVKNPPVILPGTISIEMTEEQYRLLHELVYRTDVDEDGEVIVTSGGVGRRIALPENFCTTLFDALPTPPRGGQ